MIKYLILLSLLSLLTSCQSTTYGTSDEFFRYPVKALWCSTLDLSVCMTGGYFKEPQKCLDWVSKWNGTDRDVGHWVCVWEVN